MLVLSKVATCKKSLSLLFKLANIKKSSISFWSLKLFLPSSYLRRICNLDVWIGIEEVAKNFSIVQLKYIIACVYSKSLEGRLENSG